jgi:tetratricopeptide (TPR) repeat protein
MAEKTPEDVDRKVRDLYLKGRDALERKNYDYAISLLLNALNAEPDFVVARRYLRAAQTNRFKADGNPVFKKIMAAAKFVPRLMLARTQLNKKPDAAMKLAEEALCEDPSSPAALELLADAAAALKMLDTSVDAMESVAKARPKNIRALHKLAGYYMDAGRFDKARDTYEHILEISPQDGVANGGLRNATAALSMKEGKWDSSTSYRDILKDKDQAVTLEQESRVVLGEDMIENLIRENEAKLVNEPDNFNILRTLGNLHAEKNNHDRAVEYFEKVLKLSGAADPSLEVKITDTLAKKFDVQAETWREQLQNAEQRRLVGLLIESAQATALGADAPPVDAGKEMQELQSKLDPQVVTFCKQIADGIIAISAQKNDYLLQRGEQLVARYPTETQYHYDLGLLYFQSGRLDEAIREFQLAQRNPQRRISTLNYLGLCYMAKGVADIARDVLSRADGEHKPMDGLKKEIIYNLGRAFDQSGDSAKAYEQFKRIYEVDIGYRDVSARVEKGPGPKPQ